jgi:peptidoglycan/xylan/chitin deacetylase (PgdA/CDA1 family)
MNKRLLERSCGILKRTSPVAVILAYHRVNEGLNDPQRLMICPDCFAEQMDALREMTCPVRLEDLLGRLKKQGHREPPLSAVTFDDGYADNFRVALPILKRMGIPATVFVATDAIGCAREFWWDELERILLQPHRPDALCIRLGNKEYKWSFESDCSVPGRSWDVCEPPCMVAQKAYLQIAAHLRSCPLREQEMLLAELCKWAGIERRPRDAYRTLTEKEIKQLAGEDLICIGSHSISHCNFGILDRASQAWEIRSSQARLTRLAGSLVRTFAYPYGRTEDYNRLTLRVLKKNGFEYACTTVPGVVTRWTSPLQLPRFTVGNWPGRVFKEKLAEFIQVRA